MKLGYRLNLTLKPSIGWPVNSEESVDKMVFFVTDKFAEKYVIAPKPW